MKSGPFEEFTRQLEEVANQWPDHHPEVIETPKASVYTALAEVALSEVKHRSPDLPDKLTSHNARHGGHVITRYLGLSALAAERDSISLEEFEPIIRHDRSFETLSFIANNKNAVAYRTEVDLGIGTEMTGNPTPFIEKYQITDGAVTVPDLKDIRARHLIDVMSEGKEHEGQCAAERSQSLKKIYNHFITICLKDEALFKTTLTK